MEDSNSEKLRRRVQDAVIPALMAVIPARRGSKGLHDKNTTPLAGSPLVQHTITQAIDARVFSSIVVTTDCPKVRAIAERFPITILDRPEYLATDDARIEDAILDLFDTIGYPAAFVLLQPTSPLRTARQIRDAVEIFMTRSVKSVMSVCEVSHHPYKSLTLRDGRLEPAFSKSALSAPRQDLPTCVRQNGALYVCDTEEFRRMRTFLLEPCAPYLMTKQDSIDIDCVHDLREAESALRFRDEHKVKESSYSLRTTEP